MARISSQSVRRSVARKLALQGLYRWQINEGPWQDVIHELESSEDMPRADREYVRDLVRAICDTHAELDAELAAWTDRKPRELDPIEHAVLLIGVHELKSHAEVPYRVVLSEAVRLAKRFGATDGYKFVNAVLDRAAKALRPDEH
jgi:transcription antitermination protein NusB